MSYECHITVAVKDAAIAENVAETRGWKTSEIKRDPLLGDDSHFYLTAHANTFQHLYTKMNEAADDLKHAGVKILREKIEHIVYDTKTKIGTRSIRIA